MDAQLRSIGFTVAGAGILIQFLCILNSLNPFDTSNAFLVNGGFILGELAVIVGCALYAKAKGRHLAFGLFGAFSIPGFFIVSLLKDKPTSQQAQ